jgi:hypothetical protein
MNANRHKIQPPYGISTEVRKRQGFDSRSTHNNQMMTTSQNLDSKSMTGLSHN